MLMVKKIITLVSFSLIIILSFQIALAFKAYLRPSRMILYTNVTPGGIGTTKGTFEVMNLNNVSVNVEFIPEEGIFGMVEFEENPITLEPNETKNVDFTIEVTEPGTYKGRFLAVYSSEIFPDVQMQADVGVVAREVENPTNYIPIIAILAIALISVSYIIVRKRRK